ncbi:MAG TPA: hypothetical protein VHL34_04830 [Rhizomicrobium sp.]|jgi:hypothetical protein|nr:hypothetical protein [Rhizomicrobium sp.]
MAGSGDNNQTRFGRSTFPRSAAMLHSMRVLLHIGQSKTGTTSLQQSLFAARDALLAKGILYPTPGSGPWPDRNHNGFMLGFGVADRLMRGMRRRFEENPEELGATFREFCGKITTEIEAHKPDILVLSSEGLFRRIGEKKDLDLRNFLRNLSPDVDVVAYVRRPSSHYLARCQQRLRGSGELPPPRPSHARLAIKSYQDHFAGRVRVHAYESSLLNQGDIVKDFMSRYLPQAADCVSTVRSNEGMSAEVMEIVQDFRNTHFPDSHNRFNRPTDKLIDTLTALTQQEGLPTRAKLRHEIAKYIDSASVDMRWLRDEMNVTFPNFDYDDLGKVKPPELPTPLRVSDICALDPAIKDQLNTVLAAAEASTPDTKEERKARRALAKQAE